MKKSVLYVVGGLVGGAALVSALGMKNANMLDQGGYQLIASEGDSGTVWRIDTFTGDVYLIDLNGNARKVAFK